MKMMQARIGVSCFALLAAALGALLGSCALPEAPADRYAVVIGVGAYLHVSQLGTNPALDATRMSEVLTASGWYVKSTLLNGQATRSAMLDSIADLVPLARAGSSILVYFSGHGIDINGTAYIAPVDTSANADPNSLISSTTLSAAIAEIPCINKILILDSCYSGGFIDRGFSVDSAPQNYGNPSSDGGFAAGATSTALKYAAWLLSSAFGSQSDPSVLTISAAGAEEQSYNDTNPSEVSYPSGTQSGNGVFTHFLLEAAVKGDSNNDKLVTSQEAFSWAVKGVQDYWNNEASNAFDYVGGMYMDFLPRISGGSGDIVLYDLR